MLYFIFHLLTGQFIVRYSTHKKDRTPLQYQLVTDKTKKGQPILKANFLNLVSQLAKNEQSANAA